MSEDEARAGWPDLMRIVETRVKPERIRNAADGVAAKQKRAEKWWQFSALAKDLYDTISTLPRVLACGQTSKYRTVTFLANNMVYDQKIIVFAFASNPAFAVMSSRLHETWAVFFGSTLEDRPVYTPTDCFETFPFPADVLEHAAGDSPTTDNGPLTSLETAGCNYYEFRAALMVRHNEGLTKTSNRFHDPHETSPDILQLRALHAAMDRAVLEAYAWHDLVQTATCEFLLDYEDDEDEVEPTGRARTRKKTWRYRWPNLFRDEVLARLLELNAQRHQEELLAGKALAAAGAASKTPQAAKKRGTKPPSDDLESPGLF